MTRYDLLIVDDHPDLIDGLIAIIREYELPVENIYRAYNGYEAVEVMDRHAVDIVISDIRMPVMSGLELIRQLRLRSDKVRIIVLSGYSDFEYAQEAIRYRVQSYLLKPVEETELISQLANAIQELEREREDMRQKVLWRISYTERKQMLLEKLLSGLLDNGKCDPDAIDGQLAALESQIRRGMPFTLLLIRLEGKFLEYAEDEFALMKFAVNNMAADIVSSYARMQSCSDSYDYMVLMLADKERREGEGIQNSSASSLRMVRSAVRQLQAKVGDYLGGTISVSFVNQWGIFPEDIQRFYNRALAGLRSQPVNVSNRYLDIEPQEAAPASSAQHHQTLYESPLLFHVLESRQWNKASEKLHAIFDEVEAIPDIPISQMKEIYYGISGAYAYMADKYGIVVDEITNNPGELSGGVFRSKEQFRRWAMRVLEELRHRIGADEGRSDKDLVQRIHQLVEEHLHDNPSLQMLAESTGFHPVYLSSLYKRATGQTISDYLLRYRMDKAVRMLRKDDSKIFEISERLGYKTPQYFIKVFKQCYGLTPIEFRKSLSSNDIENK